MDDISMESKLEGEQEIRINKSNEGKRTKI